MARILLNTLSMKTTLILTCVTSFLYISAATAADSRPVLTLKKVDTASQHTKVVLKAKPISVSGTQTATQQKDPDCSPILMVWHDSATKELKSRSLHPDLETARVQAREAMAQEGLTQRPGNSSPVDGTTPFTHPNMLANIQQ